MWGKLTERVRHARIKVAVAAWAYEHQQPIMSDSAYDFLAQLVHEQRHIATGDHRLDRFFQRHFDPDTGIWVHKHPNTQALERIYNAYYRVQPRRRRR